MESAYFITVSEGHLLKKSVFYMCRVFVEIPLKGMINETECDTQSGSVHINYIYIYIYIYIAYNGVDFLCIYIYIYKLFIRGTIVVEKLS